MEEKPKSSLKTSTPTSGSSAKSRFPNCSNFLWDKRCVGTEIETSFSYFRDISLSVVEKCLRLAYSVAASNFKTTRNPLFRGYFVGSLTPHDLDDEMKIIVNRFDAGLHLNLQRNDETWPTVTSKLQDEVVIPVLMANRREIEDASELVDDVFAHFVKEIEENISGSPENLIISKFFRCLCICQYTDQFGELSFDLSWNLIAPSIAILLKPINPVPIIPTALARNLSGPLSLSSLQNAPKHGFLTMDQTRKLLLLLESDPKVASLPLVGAWVSGVVSACDVSVWASLIRYCHSQKLENKQLSGNDGFLLMCYSRTDKTPSFFDCSTLHSSTSYKLFQSHEELNLFQESNKKSETTFVYFPLSLTEISPIHEVLELALRTLKNSAPDKSLLRFEDEFSSIIACSPPEEPSPCPQLVPSPHFSNHLDSVHSVPEVSVWEPEIGHDNNSGSVENDPGFFSKSSSDHDHDSSTDRMYNFPSRQIMSAPLHTIESSANIGDRSSILRCTTTESVNQIGFCGSEKNRSVLAQSECHSCQSEKSEMVLNLQQQKRQLEMLQNQIQTLLKAQNINIPDNFGKNVSTKSAQTSPAEPTSIYSADSRYCEPEVPKSIVANSPGLKSSSSFSIVDETLIPIDPNSVPILEDTQSHDNTVISHVDMPSFAESEMNETSVATENRCFEGSIPMTHSVEMGFGEYAGSIELQVVNCLNSSQIRANNIPELSDSPKKFHLQKLQAQVATALSINSTEMDHSDANKVFTLQEAEYKVVSDSKKAEVATINNTAKGIDFSYSDRMRSVDLSLEANAIAMRYGAKLEVDDIDCDFSRFERCNRAPLNFMTETANMRHVNQPLDFRSTDISFATERYLQRHGILHNSVIIEESLCQSLMKSDCNLHSTKKSNISSSVIQVLCSSTSKDQAACNQEGTLTPKEAASKRRSDQVLAPSANNEFPSDEEDNILDIEKLRALPKLL